MRRQKFRFGLTPRVKYPRMRNRWFFASQKAKQMATWFLHATESIGVTQVEEFTPRIDYGPRTYH